ncbi:MAG: hypothetical protein Q9159_006194 [Coniocarpon cinnabarinum]
MTLLQSLGRHTPAGLDFLHAEGLVDKDAESPQYRWLVYGGEHGGQAEEEIIHTAVCVVWSRGGINRRVFRFDHEGEEVQQALLTWFPSTHGLSSSTSNHTPDVAKSADTQTDRDTTRLTGSTPQRSRALVVLLQHQIQIFSLNGDSHTVNVPFDVDRMFSAPRGLLIQRKVRQAEQPSSPDPISAPPNSFWSSQNPPLDSQPLGGALYDLPRPGESHAPSRGSFSIISAPRSAPASRDPELPTLFTLIDPVAELGLAVEGIEPAYTKATTRLEPLAQDEQVLYVTAFNELYDNHDNEYDTLMIIVTANQTNQSYSIWHASYASAEVSTGRNANVGDAAQAATPPHVSRPKKRRSYAARMSTGAGTPALRGNDLPAEKLRGRPALSSFDADKSTGQRLSESFMLDEDYETDFPSQEEFEVMSRPGRNTRSTRRTSSMLARAELSSQDQNTFSDIARLPPGAGNSFGRYNRRPPSFGYGSLNKSRMSGRASTPGSTSFLSDVDESVNQDATDIDGIEELLASANLEASDRAAFRMTRGLKKELVLMRAQSIPFQKLAVAGVNAVPAPDDDCKVVVLGPNLSVSRHHRPSLQVWFSHPSQSTATQITIPLTQATLVHASSSSHKKMLVPSNVSTFYHCQGIDDIARINDVNHARIVALEKGDTRLLLHILASAASWDTVGQGSSAHSSIEVQVPVPPTTDSNQARTTLSSISRDSGHQLIPQAPRKILNSGVIGGFDIFAGPQTHDRLQLWLHPRQADSKHLLALAQRALASSPQVAVDLTAIWLKVETMQDPHPWLTQSASTIITLLVLVLGLSGSQRSGALQSMQDAGDSLAKGDLDAEALLDSMKCDDTWAWCVDEVASLDDKFDERLEKQWLACIQQSRSILLSITEHGDPFWKPIFPNDAQHDALWRVIAAVHIFVQEKSLRLDRSGSLEERLASTLFLQLAHWFNIGPILQSFERSPCNDNVIDRQTILRLSTPAQHKLWPDVFKQLSTIDELSVQQLESFHTLWDSDRHARNASVSENKAQPSRTIFDALRSTVELHLRHHENRHQPASSTMDMTAHSLSYVLPQSLINVYNESSGTRQRQPMISSNETGNPIRRPSLASIAHTRVRPAKRQGVGQRPLALEEPQETKFSEHSEHGNARSADRFDGSGESLLRHIFRLDRRWAEAERLIDPVKPATATLHLLPNQSESAFLEAQKELAQKVYQRTMALPSGQAVLRFGVHRPHLTEKIKVHTFNTTCKIQPSKNSVNADKSNFTEEKVGWAFFHAGVNAGLQVSRDTTGIDNSWLVLNKPNDLGNRHAGLLLGLGLNGHLKKMARWLAFKYLTSKHTMTSVGLLLGLSASHLGTQDSLVTRLISVHVTRLLPPGAAQLNISPLTQTAGIMGVGMLYCNTQHRRMSEVMLSELECVDLEEENPNREEVKDESYRLAAGCSLGLINLGTGADLRPLHDMGVASRLLTIITGPRQIKTVHILDQATAGATLAIAMIYMKTHDRHVADRIDPLDSAHQFESMRPDSLLLRTVAKWLILWNDIEPSIDWCKRNCGNLRSSKSQPLNSDNIPLYNIRAGLCWAVALRHAGSGDQSAIHVLRHYLHSTKRMLAKSTGKAFRPSFDESLTLDTLRRFEQLLALGLATICAGTGDLGVLRELRALHGEVENKSFGSHQATHIAIGLLFVGHGRYTFGQSNLAIAALLIAFYPIFPRDVQDSRAHLQALRHLWVLGVEERCLTPRLVDTGAIVVTPISIRLKATDASGTGEILEKEAPCHIPPLDTIASITTRDPAYYTINLDFERDPQQLAAFRKNQALFLQRRPLSLQYDSTFGSEFVRRALDHGDKSEATQLIEWLFDLSVFKELGFDGVTDGIVKLPISKDGETEGVNPLAMIETQPTFIDDVLMLLADAKGSRDWNRLKWLRRFLEQEAHAEESDEHDRESRGGEAGGREEREDRNGNEINSESRSHEARQDLEQVVQQSKRKEWVAVVQNAIAERMKEECVRSENAEESEDVEMQE